MHDWALWIHIAAMTVAFATLPVAGLILRLLVGRLPDPRPALRALSPVFAAGGLAVAVGLAAGLWLASGIGFGERWLVASYGLTALAAAIGVGIDERWSRRLAAAAPDAVARIRAERLPRLGAYAGPVCWLAILWLMVAKPA